MTSNEHLMEQIAALKARNMDLLRARPVTVTVIERPKQVYARQRPIEGIWKAMCDKASLELALKRERNRLQRLRSYQ